MNAALNSLSATFLVAGFIAVKNRLYARHMKLMFSALASSIACRLAAWFPHHAVQRGDRFEKFCRDAKGFDILEGTGDMQRLMVARAFEARVA